MMQPTSGKIKGDDDDGDDKKEKKEEEEKQEKCRNKGKTKKLFRHSLQLGREWLQYDGKVIFLLNL